MKKIIINKMSLVCTMQHCEPIDLQDPTRCFHGILGKKSDGTFHFEETLPAMRSLPNPKLFSGRYVSLSHMKNGCYRLNVRPIRPDVGCAEKATIILAMIKEIDAAMRVIY